MGKSKKRSRASKARLNPLKNETNSSSKDANLVTKKIQPLLAQLQSATTNDRSMAISSISVLCEDPHMRQLLLKEKLIHIILTHSLNDSNKDIVIEAYGLLRNLTLEEGYDISTYLWRNEIWVSIKNGFEQIVSSLEALQQESSSSASNKSQQVAHNQSKRLLFDYSDNLISLLVSLTNNSDNILNEVLNEENLKIIFDLILNYLNYGFNILPIALQNTILDLVYDFSSESMNFIDELLKYEPIITLIKQLNEAPPKNELSQILVQGILLQLLETDENITLDSNQCINFLQAVVEAVKDINLEQMNNELNYIIKDEVDIPKLKEQAKKRQNAMMQLQAVEISLDVVAGIIEMISSLNVTVSDNLFKFLLATLPSFLDALLQDFPDRVFIAWNNMLWLLAGTEETIDKSILTGLWNKVTTFEDKNNESIKMGKISVMWVILKICGNQADVDLLQEFGIWNNVEFVNTIIQQYNEVTGIDFRQRCCALLATVACFQTQDLSVNEKVGAFLIKLLSSKDTPVDILIEALSSIFEIYSDCDFTYDVPVFVNGNYLSVLEQNVVPNLKEVFKMVDKNKNPAQKEKCTEMFSTLQSFIHYKANERS
ncbi:similar to Saccharomyces cerevisiae YDL063C Protein required for biogenesis of the large ribosomal subunit [Maudiozyma barnettii]|uniref:Similar to Saccharomyces cerevisiae YDL063C Protein required for biogenesis of the large ribosomal subunit n=1 Tax=Maudiozyma barnettii TaxID=61262 RepID=A0A8H2VJM3_9SACH|nr:Syo1p [Kazachstania barnettii]CAB4256976.1 similar to Saccharomyces cerevisiae YDL063C Protein required for biogenesis of the large ribosomal subunit [Kazachstania barnettii]CAD1779347.1 similar to Saccharomyces cerevisiae YDL063C Protein required for biogenesis of the large ribosomal subunit [Kazachstania barnettii]